MKMNAWLRQAHRWLALAFTVTVLINVAAAALGNEAVWVGFLALAPLILLMLTGLYLFALPYAARRRAGRGG